MIIVAVATTTSPARSSADVVDMLIRGSEALPRLREPPTPLRLDLPHRQVGGALRPVREVEHDLAAQWLVEKGLLVLPAEARGAPKHEEHRSCLFSAGMVARSTTTPFSERDFHTHIAPSQVAFRQWAHTVLVMVNIGIQNRPCSR